jgi:hypothetical protein
MTNGYLPRPPEYGYLNQYQVEQLIKLGQPIQATIAPENQAQYRPGTLLIPNIS